MKKDSKLKSKKQENLENIGNEELQKIDDKVEFENNINCDLNNSTAKEENCNITDRCYEYKLQILREYGYNVNDEQKKLLKEMDENILEDAIKISLAQGGKSFSYVYKVYSNKNNFNKPKNNSHNNKKQPINMCDTTIFVDGEYVSVSDLSGDRFNEIVEERARTKNSRI